MSATTAMKLSEAIRQLDPESLNRMANNYRKCAHCKATGYSVFAMLGHMQSAHNYDAEELAKWLEEFDL